MWSLEALMRRMGYVGVGVLSLNRGGCPALKFQKLRRLRHDENALCRFESGPDYRLRAQDVGAQKRTGIGDRTVNVGLGGKMRHHINPLAQLSIVS